MRTTLNGVGALLNNKSPTSFRTQPATNQYINLPQPTKTKMETSMENFTLDPRLDNDCITLGKFGTSTLLLFNNSLLPWFILVPPTTVDEVFKLSPQQQQALFDESNQLGQFISTTFNTDKINTAAIGNIVRQLHIHVVGRYVDDFCWPNVVWGNPEKQAYTNNEVQTIVDQLNETMATYFTAN